MLLLLSELLLICSRQSVVRRQDGQRRCGPERSAGRTSARSDGATTASLAVEQWRRDGEEAFAHFCCRRLIVGHLFCLLLLQLVGLVDGRIVVGYDSTDTARRLLALHGLLDCGQPVRVQLPHDAGQHKRRVSRHLYLSGHRWLAATIRQPLGELLEEGLLLLVGLSGHKLLLFGLAANGSLLLQLQIATLADAAVVCLKVANKLIKSHIRLLLLLLEHFVVRN